MYNDRRECGGLWIVVYWTITAEDRLQTVSEHPTVPYRMATSTEDEQLARSTAFLGLMARRRSVRDFSDRPVPKRLIEDAVRTAATAPSGAHLEPWTFVLTGDSVVKRAIRLAAEEEERRNYEGGRLPPEWRAALAPLGTDWRKPFLETVPWIVVVFAQRYGYEPGGEKRHHYYVAESVGIACGLFIAALHNAGLATLTHTPSPMRFLSRMLGRPDNERPYILFPIGYPAENCEVPDLARKSLSDLLVEVNEDDLERDVRP